MEEFVNIYYFSVISEIGGIETWLYYLAKKYRDIDITIFYSQADYNQIKRLRKYVRVLKYNNQKIKCKQAIFCFNLDIINNVEADEYIFVAHGDYKDMIQRGQLKASLLPDNPKITRYIGISQLVCNSYQELTGHKMELCYNPIEIDKPKRILKLISATRLTPEKGKKRMEILANELDKANIPYVWFIFTNDNDKINNKNIIYMKPNLDITGYMQMCDSLVQLSDSEGYCYSVVENLTLGKPVIITDLPVYKELGINETNAYILKHDMSNLNADELYDKILNMNVCYNPPKDNWGNILIKEKNTYEEGDIMIKCRAIRDFTLARFDEIIKIERINENKNDDLEKWIRNSDIIYVKDDLFQYLNDNIAVEFIEEVIEEKQAKKENKNEKVPSKNKSKRKL